MPSQLISRPLGVSRIVVVKQLVFDAIEGSPSGVCCDVIQRVKCSAVWRSAMQHSEVSAM